MLSLKKLIINYPFKAILIKKSCISIVIILFVNFSSNNHCYAGPNKWTICGYYNGWAIAVSPSEPNVIFATAGEYFTDRSMLYRSLDQGNTWSLITALGAGNMIDSIAVDPYSSLTVYLGTWRNYVMRSVDGGNTFQTLSRGLHSSFSSPVAIDPTHSNIVYAGGYFSISTNYGQTWTISTIGINEGGNSIVVDSTNSKILYCTGDYRVYKSKNGGKSWGVITTGLQGDFYGGLLIHPDNPQVLYLTTNKPYYNFFISTTGGDEWFLSNNGLTTVLATDVVLDPGNHKILYLSTDGNGVYRSLDGASTWNEFNNDGSTYGSDLYHIIFSTVSPLTLFVTGYGLHSYSFISAGVSASRWTQLDTSLITSSQAIKPDETTLHELVQ